MVAGVEHGVVGEESNGILVANGDVIGVYEVESGCKTRSQGDSCQDRSRR